MSESNPSAPAQPVVQPPAEGVVVKSKGLTSSDLNTRVADLIAAEAPALVLTSVLTTLRTKEVDKRAAALLGGLELANSTRGALSKAKEPDVRPTMFTAGGQPIGESGFSRPRLKEQENLTKKLAKIEKAITAATPTEESGLKPDFSLLYNLKSDIEKDQTVASE